MKKEYKMPKLEIENFESFEEITVSMVFDSDGIEDYGNTQ